MSLGDDNDDPDESTVFTSVDSRDGIEAIDSSTPPDDPDRSSETPSPSTTDTDEPESRLSDGARPTGQFHAPQIQQEARRRHTSSNPPDDRPDDPSESSEQQLYEADSDISDGAMPTGQFHAPDLKKGAQKQRDSSPPPTDDGSTTEDASSSQQFADADISSGSIPTGRFDATSLREGAEDDGDEMTIGDWTFSIPSFTWIDDTSAGRRITYGAGGLIAGIVIGGLFGVLNTLLQGWSLTDGAAQILGLATALGIVLTVFASARPARTDELLARLGLVDD